MPSPELAAILAHVPPDFADPSADHEHVRRTFAPFHGHTVRPELQMDFPALGGVRCGRYTDATLPSDARILFHCHGGAFVSCPLDVYHFYADMLLRYTGSTVVMPDYRLAPEHRFPAAQDDCFNAYRGLIESGVDPARVVVVGESCGGSLSLAALVRARDAGLPMPAGYVSLGGWFDLSVSGPELPPGLDCFLTPGWVRARGRDCTGGAIALDDPRLSPAFADLRGLPPLYLQVAEYDTVREGALRVAQSATRAGVRVLLESWPGVVHAWQGLADQGVPESLAAWRRIRAFLEEIAP